MVLGISSNYQILHWGHEQLGPDSEPEGNIPEDHHGDLETAAIHLNTAFGLSDKINIDLTVSFGNRWMDYKAQNLTIHHRDESTRDSMGVYMGATIISRYLLLNETIGAGKRIFFGLGLVMPSKNTLKNNPYVLTNNLQRHTHFAISDGNLKAVFEFQYFNRKKGLFFFGSTFRLDKALKANDYGYKTGDTFLYNGFIFLHHQKTLKFFSPYLSISVTHKTKDFWTETKYAENSDGGFANLGIGINKTFDSFTFNLMANTTISSWITPANDEADKIDSKLRSYFLAATLSKIISY